MLKVTVTYRVLLIQLYERTYDVISGLQLLFSGHHAIAYFVAHSGNKETHGLYINDHLIPMQQSKVSAPKKRTREPHC